MENGHPFAPLLLFFFTAPIRQRAAKSTHPILVVGAIETGIQGELIVPHGNTRIEAGDRLTLMGSAEHIETARPIFEQF